MAIGTIAALALGGVASSAIGASSAKKASKAQSQAASNDLALQERVYEEGVERFAPFLEGGQRGYDAYMYELGLGDAPKGYGGYEESPAYDFLMQQGLEDVQSSAAARGGLYSGATGTALERYRMGLAAQEQEGYLNRLGGLASQGQAAAGSQAGLGQAYAQGAGQAYGNLGAAQASGAIGVGSAIQSGINTGMNLYGFMNQGGIR